MGLFFAGKFVGFMENNLSTSLRATALQHTEVC
jgi:hypothetical protein